jgi:outer membrane receptor protein involved in Fe transport
MDYNQQASREGTQERDAARGVRRAALIALALVPLAAPAWAEGPVTQFKLPAEPLPQAVIDFYRQSGVQAIYAATPQVQRLKTQPVTGRMDSSAALKRMLAGTGLTFFFDTPSSVIIRPVARGDGAVARPKAVPVAVALKNPQPDLKPADLRPVEVTGSLISGVRSAIAPLVYLRRADLDRAAYPNVQQALYALPLVSLDGPREDLGVDNNGQYGAAINLRGLGTGATLVLVNGHRQPFGGLTGDFVDVSTIPWSAVRRIEVLPDGASALYGADAVAGVVNIIMRDNFTGAKSEVRYGTAVGGRAEWMAAQLFGTRWSSGHAMMDYEYSDATPLAAAARPYAANANKTPYGGANYDTYYSNPGNVLDPFTLQPSYGITAAGLSRNVNLQNPFTAAQIFPDRMAQEFYGSVSQRIGSNIELFAQGRYTERNTTLSTRPNATVLQVPASNPYYVNPFAGVPYTLVAYNFLPLLGPTRFGSNTLVYSGTAGATFRLGHRWRMTVSESGGKQILSLNQYGVVNPAAVAGLLQSANPAVVFNPFAANPSTNVAAAASIAQTYFEHSAAGIQSSDVVASGPLMRLPAGRVKLAVGFERRTETLEIAQPAAQNLQNTPLVQSFGRRVESVFSQLHVPLLGSPVNRALTPRLALDLAGRYDDYSDFGGTFNPTARLQWTASQWLKLHASWGQSYRAPKLADLYDTSQNIAGLVSLVDPSSPSGRSLVLAEQGSNPALREETARTWTAGIDLSPWRRAQISVTYYSINYRNRIEQPAADDPFGILQHQAEWSAVINRNPTRAQIAAICDSSQFFGSAESCLVSQPVAIVDLRLANLATTRTRGLDIEAQQHIWTRWGHFQVQVRGEDVLSFTQSVTPNSPAVSILDTVGNPLAVRLQGTLTWSRHGVAASGWGGALIVNYTGAYHNPGSTLMPDVPQWTTFDADARYRLQSTDLGPTTVTLNGVNLFNQAPPFVDSLYGYDVANVQALGRVLSLQVTQRW